MLKWLLVIAVIAVVYFLFIKSKPLKKSSAKPDETTLSGDDMVECQECGTYISLSEARLGGGKYYCSDECLKA